MRVHIVICDEYTGDIVREALPEEVRRVALQCPSSWGDPPVVMYADRNANSGERRGYLARTAMDCDGHLVAIALEDTEILFLSRVIAKVQD